jgi:hypothetical protein
MKTESTTSAPKVGSSALVRHCKKCLAVTAFDLDATCANERALRMRGQTVRIMDAAEVLGMKLERCKCLPNVKMRDTAENGPRKHSDL